MTGWIYFDLTDVVQSLGTIIHNQHQLDDRMDLLLEPIVVPEREKSKLIICHTGHLSFAILHYIKTIQKKIQSSAYLICDKPAKQCD
jgi:methyl coenzyme M reductase subunit C